jgi:hypothetical protein
MCRSIRPKRAALQLAPSYLVSEMRWLLSAHKRCQRWRGQEHAVEFRAAGRLLNFLSATAGDRAFSCEELFAENLLRTVCKA